MSESQPTTGPSAAEQAVLATIDLVEHDILGVVRDVHEAAEAASGEAAQAGGAVESIRGQTRYVTEAAGRMAQDMRAIAGASDEFSASASEIVRIASDAAAGADRAGASASLMEQSFAELARAASEIGSIIDSISHVARQTNLLALNATIEAARAGEAGRGFAVVAQEVKSLSGASERASSEIRQRVAALSSVVADATSEARRVAGEVNALQPLFAAAASASEQQRQSTEELTRQVNDAAQFSTEVQRRMGEIETVVDHATVHSAAARAGSAKVSSLVSDMGRRFVTVVRQTAIGDRRRAIRLPAELQVRAVSGQGIVETRTIDLSTGGLLLADDGDRLPGSGATLDLKVAALPAVKGKIVNRSPLGAHVAFLEPSAEFSTAVAALFNELEQQALPLIRRSQTAAGDIARLFEDAIGSGVITEQELFDVTYKPVPGTDPQQFTTALLPRLEAWLSPVQETLKASDSRIVFCCTVDRNGYLPVHNLEYSKPQRPDDPVWNAANARNRRIFDDRAGLTCARSTQPYMIHAYRRDMGGGNIIVLKEYVAPIAVRGRHWGGFRCAYAI